MTQMFSSADLALAQRIEAGHAHSASVFAASDAIERIGGGWAVFQSVDSPMTQAIGIGMNGAVSAVELDRLEAFFYDRGSPAIIDLCTLADPSLQALVQQRRYTVREISNVMARRLDPGEELPDVADIEVQPVAESEMGPWAAMVAQGFAGEGDVPAEHVDVMATAHPALEAFFGLHGGRRVAGAAMAVQSGLATLFGDATLVQGRGHGLQLALIRHRIRRASQLGCDLASASVVPGGISHRNYERAGFQLVYARVMVGRGKADG
jgi:GNAT superfamily N-acetyltransferase